MKLTGLHLLLTYTCNLECDHCFVWSGPWQNGTMTLQDIRHILSQAQDIGTVTSIYFEGGEAFLFYPILLKGIQLARELGFSTGIVSNGYWAKTVEDAKEWLRPFAGLLDNLSVSSDLYHWNAKLARQARNAQEAAEALGIPLGVISIAQPENATAPAAVGQLPESESALMYRGRAVAKLAASAPKQPWETFTTCPYEDLRDPGRVHVDPFGHLHICQGISLGNIFETPLREIWEAFDPDEHPITAPLLAGGPAELARRYGMQPEPAYADACHLCDTTRRDLRLRFPEILAPDQMYGATG
jgi:MoaA/NifB/PqqE/SkfB family radical SAM enzyme